jgi:two-component system sensor histidine kinase/response regulator
MRSDVEKVKAVIQNLISNAIKFAEKGGVTVQVRHVPEPDVFEFNVTDTGLGIRKEKVQAIFDMFEQVDSSATRTYGGVGLGLYIVKEFNEILGGRVDVKCELSRDPRSWYVCL